MAEALAVLGGASAVLELSKAACSLSAVLYTSYRNTKNVKETIKDLAGDVEALGKSCLLVHALLETLEEDYDRYKTLWVCVRTQVQECDRTMENLGQCLVGIKREGASFIVQAQQQIKLEMRKDRIAEFRSRVKLHMSCLQVTLQSANIVVSNLAPRRADRELLRRIDVLAQDVKDMKQMHRISKEYFQKETWTDHSHNASLRLSEEISHHGKMLYRESVQSGAFVSGCNTNTVVDLRFVESTRMKTVRLQHAALDQKSVTEIPLEPGYESLDESPMEPEDTYKGQSDLLAHELAEITIAAATRAFQTKKYEETISLVEQLLDALKTGQMRLSSAQATSLHDLMYFQVISSAHSEAPTIAESKLKDFISLDIYGDAAEMHLYAAKHALAKLYIETCQLGLARNWCAKALAGRRKHFDSQSPPVLESVNLMWEINRKIWQAEQAENESSERQTPLHRRVDSKTSEDTPSIVIFQAQLGSASDKAKPAIIAAGGLQGSMQRPNMIHIKRSISSEEILTSSQSNKLHLLSKSKLPPSVPPSPRTRPIAWVSPPLSTSPTFQLGSPKLPASVPVSPRTRPIAWLSPSLSPNPTFRSHSSSHCISSEILGLYRGVDAKTRQRWLSNLGIRPTHDLEKAVCKCDFSLLYKAADCSTSHKRNISDRQALITFQGKPAALHLAALFGDVKMAQVLINRGFEVDSTLPELQLSIKRFIGVRGDLRFETPLHWAAGARQAPMVQFLLRQGATLLDARPDVEYSHMNLLDLDWFRATGGQSVQEITAVLDVFLSNGWSIDGPISKYSDQTIVHRLLVTVGRGPFERVSLLAYCLSCGYRCSVKTRNGESPLTLALEAADDRLITVLLQKSGYVRMEALNLVDDLVVKCMSQPGRSHELAVLERLLRVAAVHDITNFDPRSTMLDALERLQKRDTGTLAFSVTVSEELLELASRYDQSISQV